MPEAIGTSTTRRAVLKTAPVAALLPVAAIAAPVDPHRGWLDEIRALDARHNRGGIRSDAYLDEEARLRRSIWRMPAKTLDGVIAQIELLRDMEVSIFHDLEFDGYRNMIATLRAHQVGGVA